MLLPDVNIYIHAHRADMPDHEPIAAWLEGARAGEETLLVADHVLAGFLRIVTMPAVFKEPSSIGSAVGFTDVLRTGPRTLAVRPGPTHWNIFRQLCVDVGARGNLVPDAYIAALAIEHGAELVSLDADFARFPGLRWRHPLRAN